MLYKTFCYIEYENIRNAKVSGINVVSDCFLCFFVNLAAHCPAGIKLKVIPQHVMSPQRGGTGM
jgi:hypothetical protein